MTRLTVTEKEHWKTRIERRIEKAIDSLANTDPTLLPSVKEQAKKAAEESLGIAESRATIAKLEREIEMLTAQKDEVEKAMQSHVLGTDSDNEYWQLRQFDKAVEKRQLIHEDELLAQSDLGKQILSLRQEKEELLDTVWLATSPVQIRDLWTRVSELLGDAPTDLQQQALTTTTETND